LAALDRVWLARSLDMVVQGVVDECRGQDARCGGKLEAARTRAAQSYVRNKGTAVGTDPLGDVGEEIADLVADKLHGNLAPGTAKVYKMQWDRWKWWATCHKWDSFYLTGESKSEKIADEEAILTYMGFLTWLGFSPGTVKQALFAVRDEHKRHGAGDPLQGADRVWILLATLGAGNPPRPRKLGATSEMMLWTTGKVLSSDAATTFAIPQLEEPGNRLILDAAIKVGYFYLCRASEYVRSGAPDFGKIMRGADVRLRTGNSGNDGDRLDVQFRKTKADQAAFGCVRTHYRVTEGVGKPLCVVTAIERLKEEFPERWAEEAPLPLFRWSNGALIRREDIQKVLERAAEAEGLPAARFRSHSLRIGGASALLHATNQFELVKRFGRWSSDAVHGYLHDSAEQWKGMAKRMAEDKSAVHYT